MFEEAPQTPAEKEKDFLRHNHMEGGTERAKKVKLFFVFDSPEIRDDALNMLNRLADERKEYDDKFTFFNGCIIDKERPDVGIEIGFAKNPQNLQKTFERILIEQGFVPKEEYETIDEVPVSITE